MSRRYRQKRRKRCRVQGCRHDTARLVDVEGVRLRVCGCHQGPLTLAMLKPHVKPNAASCDRLETP
jgi:hypothetical protein